MVVFKTGPVSTPNTADSLCLPHLSHLIQLISSLVETARPEMGVSDTYKRAVLGCLQDWLKNHCSKAMLAALMRNFLKPASAPDAQYQDLTSLINPCEACSEWNLSSTILGSSTITTSASIRNLGVIFNDLQRAQSSFPAISST